MLGFRAKRRLKVSPFRFYHIVHAAYGVPAELIYIYIYNCNNTPVPTDIQREPENFGFTTPGLVLAMHPWTDLGHVGLCEYPEGLKLEDGYISTEVLGDLRTGNLYIYSIATDTQKSEWQV